MIRVLNVISALNNAGTEAVVMNYYRHMDRSKVQFDFLVLDTAENAYYEKEIEGLGGKIFKIPSFRQEPLRCIAARKRFFKEHKYDIVEVHSPSALRYAYCKLAKKSGAKVIFHVHSISNQKGFLINYARKQIERYCDETVTCSQDAAVSVLGHKADKIVYNAIDYGIYKFDENKRKQIRAHYGFSDKEKVIGHVGRFSMVKNHLFLLNAFRMAAEKDADLRLVMKGFGELEGEIRDFVEKNNLGKCVVLADRTYSAAELYNAFDLFVQPSLFEGLSVVTVEAQANGLQCAVSDRLPQVVAFNGFVRFLDLDAETWVNVFNEKKMYERVPRSFDFFKTDYEICSAAQKRMSDYEKLAYGKN